jgi:hypothetical protein
MQSIAAGGVRAQRQAWACPSCSHSNSSKSSADKEDKKQNAMLPKVCVPVSHSGQDMKKSAPLSIWNVMRTHILFAVKRTNTYFRHCLLSVVVAELRRVAMGTNAFYG